MNAYEWELGPDFDRMEHHFQTLGVPVSASRQQVRQAYRDLLKVWHPDRFSSEERLQELAQKKTREIVAAYEAIETLLLHREQNQSAEQFAHAEELHDSVEGKEAPRINRPRYRMPSGEGAFEMAQDTLRTHAELFLKARRKASWFKLPLIAGWMLVNLLFDLCKLVLFTITAARLLVPLALLIILFYGKSLFFASLGGAARGGSLSDRIFRHSHLVSDMAKRVITVLD